MNKLAIAIAIATTSAALATGCGSGYTVLDRSTIAVSDNARISAQSLVAFADKFPNVTQQLALAQEIYQQQLRLLKERRNKVRSRERYLNAFSYGTFALTTAGIGTVGLVTDEANSSDTFKIAGVSAIAGLAVGTVFQIAGFMQEDTSSLDAKIRQLELQYDTMLERLRQLALEAEREALAATGPGGAQTNTGAEMGAAIEKFITEALSINIKG